MRKKILFVDDDPAIIEAIRRMLRPLRGEWDVSVASGGKEALAILDETPFDMVVSDMRMPGMDGAQLLDEVKKRRPEAVRIILSGQADKSAFMRSSRTAHQFLSKPCSSDALRAAIERAYSLHRFLSNPEIQKLLSRTETLPSLPELYFQAVKALESPDCSLEEMGKIISKDMGMTAKILQLANSAFFGTRQKIADPVHAVQILGLDMIQPLVLSCHIFEEFKKTGVRSLPVYQIWAHSLIVGGMARSIAKLEKAGPEMENFAFVSGLLHDVGKMALAANLPEDYGKALALAKEKKMAHWQAEAETLGVTHAEAGAYLMALWGLPDPVAEAIAYHHRPSQCRERSFGPLTLVHVANALAGERYGAQDEYPTPVDEDYLREVGLLHRLPEWRNPGNEDDPLS